MSATTTSPNLTSGRLLARNAIWNFIGQLLPMAVAILAIPPLVHSIGVPRFGVLSLAWTVTGYLSLFDLGIGRALTKLISDKLGAHEDDAIPPLVWTSLSLMFLLGIIGALFSYAITPWLVYKGLHIPQELQTETLHAFYLLAVSMPVVIITPGLRGILEAQQRFRVVNLIRIPMTVFSFAGPLLVLPFSHRLVPVVAILVFGRFTGTVIHLTACLVGVSALRGNVTVSRSLVMPLLKFGGWMTVSNIVSPLMAFLDRFLLGALLSVSAVAYYTAPFDLVTKLWLVPAALGGVLFPAFAVSLIQDPSRTILLLNRGVKYVFLILLPSVMIIIAFAPEGLRLWLGASFGENSAAALRWLAAGVLINSIAQLPFSLIQSAGKPDITAKLHLVELPIYLSAVWLLTKRLGIEGTAIAWSGRVCVDAVILFFFAHRLFRPGTKFLVALGGSAIAGLLFCYACTLPSNPYIRLGMVLLGIIAVVTATLLWALAPAEHQFLEQRTFLSKSSIMEGVSMISALGKLRKLDRSAGPDEIADFVLNDKIIRASQVPSELREFAEIVAKRKPKTILEIGTFRGGTLLMLCRLAHPEATVVSVDLPNGFFGGGYKWYRVPLFKAFIGKRQKLHLLRENSHEQRTFERVSRLLNGRKLDLLFIDGDHTYDGVRTDFELYSPLVAEGGMIAFHDIAEHPPALRCDVIHFWNEIKQSCDHLEIIENPAQGWAGIGLLFV